MKLALAVGTIFLLLFAAIGGSYALSLHAIDQSQRKWCTTLALIQNARPPHPTGFQARYFEDLTQLYRDFGCG